MEPSRIAKITALLLAGYIALALVIVGVVYTWKGLGNTDSGPVACTQEARLCPDGSTVGRTGPNCEFAQCPDAQLKEDVIYTGNPYYAGWSQEQMQNDCSAKGGRFNECGSACLDPEEPCIKMCAYRCEFSGSDISIDTSTWNTYRNEEYGFEIQYAEGTSVYPAEHDGVWILVLSSNDTGTITIGPKGGWSRGYIGGEGIILKKENISFGSTTALKTIMLSRGFVNEIVINDIRNVQNKEWNEWGEIHYNPGPPFDDQRIDSFNKVISTLRFF